MTNTKSSVFSPQTSSGMNLIILSIWRNTADLKYDFDFDFPYGISAVNEDSDVIAAELPDDSYIFFETSVPEVLRCIRDNYSDDIDTTAIDRKLRELSEDCQNSGENEE